MNVPLRSAMTMEQFIAWEERQALRYEFDGTRAVAMNGGTATHSGLCRNILFSLTGRLRGTRCRPHGDTLKIRVAGRIRYPDAFVVCSPVAGGAKVVDDPVVVFEVLSPGTSKVDLLDKNQDYRNTPSIQRYVVLHHTSRSATMFVRRGGDWVTEVVSGEGAVLAMAEIGVTIPLAELYEDVDLPGGVDG